MTTSRLLDAMKLVQEPPATAAGLPNDTYTDTRLHHFERDAVLGKTWSAICFGNDLPNAGFSRPIEFMGMPLLVVRDRTLKIKVFHNVCRHRGMKLVHEAAPLKTVIRCPYHSWAYDLNGQLLSTPHIGGDGLHNCPGFDKSSIRLAEIKSAVWMDIVFINLSGDAPSFEEHLHPLVTRWSAFVGSDGFAQLQNPTEGARLSLHIQCNWKLAVENYCEAYHLPWVHPQLNRYSPLAEHFNIIISDHMSGQGSRNYELATVEARGLPQFSQWPKEQLKHAEYISLYPNVLLGLQADHAFAMIIQPTSESTITEHLQLSYVGDGASDERYTLCRKAVLNSWNTVFQEDIFAVEGLQKGRASPGFSGGVFTPVQDMPTHHFHQWVARHYERGLQAGQL